MAAVRGTAPAAAHVLKGGWDRDRFWGVQLRGKRLGILGHGRVGAMVAHYGAALGMEIGACDCDPTKIVAPAAAMSFETLLKMSNAISVHVTADPENRHLIDRAAITQMRPGAFLINTSRGSIVDEAALAEAVRCGHLSGVAVDVLEGEAGGDVGSSPLIACAREGLNVLITPHIGGATHEAIRQTEGAVVSCLASLLRCSS